MSGCIYKDFLYIARHVKIVQNLNALCKDLFTCVISRLSLSLSLSRGADKFLALLGRKQARKQVREARDFNNIETRAVIKFLFLQGKVPKEFHAILTETLA